MIEITVTCQTGRSGESVFAVTPSSLSLGAMGNNKYDSIHVTLPAEWADMTVRLTFVPRTGNSIAYVQAGNATTAGSADNSAKINGHRLVAMTDTAYATATIDPDTLYGVYTEVS